MLSKEEGELVMLMEDSQLQKLAKILWNQEQALRSCISDEYLEECNDAYDKVISLLDKCKNISEHFKQGSKISKAELPKDTQGHLKRTIDTIMEHVCEWCSSIGWEGLSKDLEDEIKVAYEKFCNLRKYYDDDCSQTTNQPVSDLSEADIAKDIQDYVKYAINISLQCVQNCCSRKRCVSRIEVHFEILVQELEDLNVGNQANLREMAENVLLYKQCMFEFAKSFRGGSGWMSFVASSKFFQKEQIQFSNMAERKMNELGFVGEFDGLTELQQLQVCHGIMKESGRANILILELDNRSTDVVRSRLEQYGCLLVQFIFGQGGKIMPDLTNRAFHGAQMPDGMALACQIAYSGN